jgi:hypothetical protein
MRLHDPDGSTDAVVARMKGFRAYPLTEIDDPRPTEFINASGKVLDTIHPVDVR